MKIFKQIRIIYLIAAATITVLLVLGLLYMQKSREQVKYIEAVEHTYKVLSSINYFEKLLIEAETSQRGYLLIGDEHFKSEFKSELLLIDSAFESLERLTTDNYGHKTYLFQLQKFVAVRLRLLEENIDLPLASEGYRQNLREGMISMEHCKNYMGKMRTAEEALLESRLVKKNQYQQLNLNFFIITFITSCIICIIAIGVFFRELGIRLATQQNLRGKIQALSNSKQELEQVTFAASHDLQEPMRKVRILSSMIIRKYINKVPEGDMDVLQRINKVTEKMQGQLNDLVLYTNLLAPIEHLEDINLNEVFKDVYEDLFKNASADLTIADQLPTIKGSRIQIETMLKHLLENADKFKDPVKQLAITVHYKSINLRESKILFDGRSGQKFHQVTISDNGIGFDDQYKEKIFGLFQRLHTQNEYAGKGIGLSVVRRVMSNHNGFIFASGKKMKGASFILQFPK